MYLKCKSQSDSIEEASNLLREAVTLNPQSAEYHLKLARILYARGGKWKHEKTQSYGHYLTAVRLNPMSSLAFTGIGNFHASVDGFRDDTKATKCFLKAIRLDPENEQAGKVNTSFIE